MLLRRRLSSQAGQALIIAVLLLVLLAILSATFVAFVSHALAQSGRRSDVQAAERMSVAGIHYAHRQLRTSPDLSNWRPAGPVPFPPNYYNEWEQSRISSRPDLQFPPFVKIDNPIESGDDPYSLGSAGEEQRGRCLLQVRYVPSFWHDGGGATWGTYSYPDDAGTTQDPLDLNQYDPLSPFIRVTAIGSARDVPNLLRVKVAYIPLVLPDRLMTIADAEETGRVAPFGIPTWVDVDGDGGFADLNGDGTADWDDLDAGMAREFPINRFDGGLHSNTSLSFYGRTSMGWLRGYRGDAITAAGSLIASSEGIAPPPAYFQYTPGLGFRPIDDTATIPGGLDTDWTSLLPVFPSLGPMGMPSPTFPAGVFNPYGGYVQDMWSLVPDAGVDSDVSPIDPNYKRRNAQRIRPGLLDEVDASGDVILARLAKNSGVDFTIQPGTVWAGVRGPGVYNTGEFGLGRSIYVDNPDDFQAGNPQALIDNWMRSGAQANAYWYGPLYDPPGVDVILMERDRFSTQDEWAASPPSGPNVSHRAYGNSPSHPDIVLRRNPSPSGAQSAFWVPVVGDSNGNRLADDPSDIWDPASADGSLIVDVMPLDLDGDTQPDTEMTLDYPQDGLIYITGNARVTGKLPVSRVDVVEETPAGDGLFYPRRYDVTLVSRENIYINGNLASGPNWLPPAGLDPNPLRPPYVGDAVGATEDRYAARIALLAEKNVAVNATKGVYQGDGIATDCEYVPVAPESSDSAGYWLLEPGRSWTTWFGFGGVDRSHPLWTHSDWDVGWSVHPDNPMYREHHVLLKLRVQGSQLSPFRLLINGIEYDFDTRDGAADQYPQALGLTACRQMSGSVEILSIPLIVGGQPMGPAVVDSWGEGGPNLPLYIDVTAGGLNSVAIMPSTGMTQPVRILGASIERRSGDEPLEAPILTPDGSAAFNWDPASGPPPLRRAGGDVLHSRVMQVAAMCYAQRGSFFVIGGDFFDPYAARVDRNADGRIVDAPLGEVIDNIWYASDTDVDGSGTPDWAENRRHNLQIQFQGAITQNLPPDVSAVAMWTDRLLFPIPDLAPGPNPYAPSPGAPELGWSPPMYQYDEGLRASNPLDPPVGLAWPFWAATGTAPPWDVEPAQSRFSRVPVSPDLIYFGDLA